MKDKAFRFVVLGLLALSGVQTVILWMLYDELDTMSGYTFVYLNSIQSDATHIGYQIGEIRGEIELIRERIEE